MDKNKCNNVDHPEHYKGKTSIECIDNMLLIFGEQTVVDFCIVNAYKYLSRHKYKNGFEDLCKAKWYLDKTEELKLIEEVNVDYRLLDRLNELCEWYMEDYVNE